MRIHPAVFSLLLLTLPSWPGPSGQESVNPVVEAGKRISEASLRKHVEFLASDELEGRNSGYPGNDKAVEYITGLFREYGLQPVGEEKTYHQEFEFSARGGKGREKLTTRNCLGFVEGTDEKLKEEIIVLGAHHDHVGRKGQADAGRMRSKKADPKDEIWNGADDNASGTSTVLEVARAFQEAKIRTKRSILFMTFSGEEHGLRGSAYYCAHPVFPLSRHAAMINLDMVGRNPEAPLEVIGLETSGIWADAVARSAKAAGIANLKTSPGVTGDSDHASFAGRKIPAVHLFTGLHEDYHKQTDHAEALAYGRMTEIARFTLAMLVDLGNLPQRPKFAEPRRLGIAGAPLEDDAAEELGLPEEDGGLVIQTVSEGSVAEKAGIQEGDVLVSFRGRSLPREEALETLRAQLGRVAAGEEVTIILFRGHEKIELKVRWDE